MTTTSAARTFDARHVQIARAASAAIAALMVTFSPDHSAAVGLSIFSGFVLVNALILLVSAWLVYPAGRRWPAVLLGVLSVLTGMAGGVVPLRSVATFFVLVIVWALSTGLVETIAGARGLRQARSPHAGDADRTESRDALVIGILTLVLGLALLLVPAQYALQYRVEEADTTFTLTGIILAVGIFGAYAAIVAVYLGIAGFSPRKPQPVTAQNPDATAPTALRAADASPTTNDERGVS